MNISRAATLVALILLVIFAPYWLYLPAILIATVMFPLFVEGIGFGLLLDTLYRPGGDGFFLLDFPLGICATALVVLTPFVRKRLRFNA